MEHKIPSTLTTKGKRIYKQLYNDLLEPDYIDVECITLIASLKCQVQEFEKEIQKDGVVIMKKDTHNNTVPKANPLLVHLQKTQATLSQQLNKLKDIQLKKEKMIFDRLVSGEMGEQ
ncbi:P27 family phage terminase small subunit [Vibrio sp. MED222]|uniref:P27 family phage terminase small subunit n=1 Tax=Vibrio sp. MED222 TaxID=314290 RepID=UPI000068EBCC|nr:P27 family phage terminase small subunit [Vibrio sp. MED222]EAQ55525.1 hypothetical protein MED222_08893 [Vibrio sp. MED222]